MTGKTAIMNELLDLKAENDLLKEQNKAMKDVIAAFCFEVESTAHYHKVKNSGGQKVTQTNPWCYVMPSAVNELLWWARALEQAAMGDLP